MLKSKRLIKVFLSLSHGCRFSTNEYKCARFRRTASKSSDNQSTSDTGMSRVNSYEPGVGRRLKMLKEKHPGIDEMPIDEEDIESMEEDFLHTGKMMEHYKRSEEIRNFNVGLKITERKHFKPPKEPNLLSWSEKEQIRNLHREDRQYWSAEKLAESFPATADIIQKILKSCWVPRDADKARKHDESVAQNWKDWYAGNLEIHSPNLREHLKKFNRRNFLPHSTTDYSQFANKSLPVPESKEFSSIIESYKRLNMESVSSPSIDGSKPVERLDSGAKVVHGSFSKKILSKTHTTLETLQEEVAKTMTKTKVPNEMDRHFIKKYVDKVNLEKSLKMEGKTNSRVDFENVMISKKDNLNISDTHSENATLNRSYNSKLWEDRKNQFSQPRLKKSYKNYVEVDKDQAVMNVRTSSVDEKQKNNVMANIERVNFEVGTPVEQKNDANSMANIERESLDVVVGTPVEQKNDANSVANIERESFEVEVGTPVTFDLSHGIDHCVTEPTEWENSSNHGFVSKPFESKFDANSKFPPARFNRENTIMWRPEKSKASADEIPNRIRIPRDKYKKGCLYKVKDCFYTHEGYFLYRVPGMI